MIIQIPPAVEAAIAAEAQRRGTTAEALVIDAVTARFPPNPPEPVPLRTREEWEKWLLEHSIYTGVVPPRSAMTSDELYD